jgi:hypothetical protein
MVPPENHPKVFGEVGCRNPTVQYTAGAATGTNLDTVLKITLAALKDIFPVLTKVLNIILMVLKGHNAK